MDAGARSDFHAVESATLAGPRAACFGYHRNMDEHFLETRLAQTAAAIADKTRATMLCALMDGRAYTATELSALADVAASTASSHLSKLTEQGLVQCLPQGRHRYFRLADAQTAHALENLMGLAAARPAPPRVSTPAPLRHARTCYDHMAGAVAVALHDHLLAQAWLQPDDYSLSAEGQRVLTALGMTLPAQATRRRFACACLDWSERRPHLGGALGAALLQCLKTRDWVRAHPDSRALSLTAAGRAALENRLGLGLPKP